MYGCNLNGGGGTIGIGGEIPADIASVIAYAHPQLGKPTSGAAPDLTSSAAPNSPLRAYQIIGINLRTPQRRKPATDERSTGDQNRSAPGDIIFYRGSIPIHDNGDVGIAINATRRIVAPETGDVISLAPSHSTIQTVRRLIAQAG